MTWNELAAVCMSVPESQKSNEVPVFNFSEGELCFVLASSKLGEQPENEAHCSNFNENLIPEGTVYLLTNYGQD